MTEVEQIFMFLEAHQQMIDHVENGIEKCFDRIEYIEKMLKENHIGE